MKEWLRHVFIPHEGNGYAPHALQKVALSAMLFLILLSFAMSNLLSLMWMSSQYLVSTILPAVIVTDTNKERAREQLIPLSRNQILDEAATKKAQDMAKNEYFAHYSPNGISPWYWFDEVGYDYIHAGENLAIHFTDSDAVVEAWMDSPSHRKNIMNGDYQEIGIGTAKGKYEGLDTIYVVQLFGTPADASAKVETFAREPQASALITQLERTPQRDSSPVLSETITKLPEKVEYIETATPPVVASASTTEKMPVASTAPVAITTLDAIGDSVVLQSDLMATSVPGVPASIVPHADTFSNTPAIVEMATKPHVALEIIYLVISMFVIVSLILSIFIEVRHQQPLQIAYSVCLLCFMWGLFYTHVLLTGSVLIL